MNKAWTRPLSDKTIFAQRVKKFPAFHGTYNSLLCSQEHTAGPYRRSDESRPHCYTLFLSMPRSLVSSPHIVHISHHSDACYLLYSFHSFQFDHPVLKHPQSMFFPSGKYCFTPHIISKIMLYLLILTSLAGR